MKVVNLGRYLLMLRSSMLSDDLQQISLGTNVLTLFTLHRICIHSKVSKSAEMSNTPNTSQMLRDANLLHNE